MWRKGRRANLYHIHASACLEFGSPLYCLLSWGSGAIWKQRFPRGHGRGVPVSLPNVIKVHNVSIFLTKQCTARGVSKLHTDSTSAAQHKTQGKRKADRWKIDCGRRRGEYKTLLRCPSPKTLNYYWLLLYYFNNVHIYGPIRIKSLWFWHVHIIHLLVF